MTEGLIVAIIAFVGLMLSGLIAGGITLVVQLTKWQRDNHLLWTHNRQLIDHIYRGLGPPPPAPPPGIFD